MSQTDGHLLFENVNKTVRRTGFYEHVNQTAELYVCLGGSVCDSVDGVEKKVGMGNVYVIDANTSHFQTNAKMFKCCVFQFNREVLKNQAASLGITKKIGYRLLFEQGSCCVTDNKTLLQIEALADIMREKSDPDVLDALFLSVVSLVSTQSVLRDAFCEDSHEDIIGEMMSFIEKNYSKRITLDDLARTTNYSCRHFSRIVRARLSMSPMEYLDTVRINKSCELLSTTALTVTEIGEMCGFDDGNLFSRHFRMRKGKSPSQYRQNAIEKSEAKNSAVSVNIVGKIT